MNLTHKLSPLLQSLPRHKFLPRTRLYGNVFVDIAVLVLETNYIMARFDLGCFSQSST